MNYLFNKNCTLHSSAKIETQIKELIESFNIDFRSKRFCRRPTLKCLAAQKIILSKIPFETEVPQELTTFLHFHKVNHWKHKDKAIRNEEKTFYYFEFFKGSLTESWMVPDSLSDKLTAPFGPSVEKSERAFKFNFLRERVKNPECNIGKQSNIYLSLSLSLSLSHTLRQ